MGKFLLAKIILRFDTAVRQNAGKDFVWEREFYVRLWSMTATL